MENVFSIVLLLLKPRDRFASSGMVNATDCHQMCWSKYSAMVDGSQASKALEYLDSFDKSSTTSLLLEPKKDAEETELSRIFDGKSRGLHLNVVFDFERQNWININRVSEYNAKMWLRTPHVLPYFPIMNDRIVLRGNRTKHCFDYWSTTEASTSWAELPLGMAYSNGQNTTSSPGALLPFENATKLCGDKGLWFPDFNQLKTGIETTDSLLNAGFWTLSISNSQRIWTDARRFNQSHFVVQNHTPFDATNLASCRRDAATFRPYVTLRKTKYKYGAVNMMDNGADCVC